MTFRSLIAMVLLLAVILPSRAQDGSGVPALSFQPSELLTPLRTFTTAEIGARPTFAGMHKVILLLPAVVLATSRVH